MAKKKFDYLEAKRNGYSDEEIQDFLNQSSVYRNSEGKVFDLAGAKNEGYSDEEIASYLSGIEVKKKETAQPTSTKAAVQSSAQSSPSSVSSKAVGSSQSRGAAQPKNDGGVVGYFKNMIQSANEGVKIEEEETKEQLKPVTQKLSQGKIGGEGVGSYLSGRAFAPKATKEQKSFAARKIVDRMAPSGLDEETRVKITEKVTPLIRDEDAFRVAKDEEDKTFVAGAGYQDILAKNDQLLEKANRSYGRENAIAAVEQSRTGKVARFLTAALNGETINPQDEAYLMKYANPAYKQILASKKVNNLAEYAALRKPEVDQLRIQAAQQEVWPQIAQFKDVKGIGTELTTMPDYAKKLSEQEQKEIDAIGNKYPLQVERPVGFEGGMEAKYNYTTKRDPRYDKEVAAIKNKYQEQRDKAGLADAISFAANQYKTKEGQVDPLKVGEQMIKTSNPNLYKIYKNGGGESRDISATLYKAGLDVMRNSGSPELYRTAQDKEKQYDALYPEMREKDVIRKMAIEKVKKQGGAATIYNKEYLTIEEGDDLSQNLNADEKLVWQRVKNKYIQKAANTMGIGGYMPEANIPIPQIGGLLNEFVRGAASPVIGIATTISGIGDTKKESANKALKDNWIAQKLLNREETEKQIAELESKKKLTADEARQLIELKSRLGLKSKGQEWADLGAHTLGQLSMQGAMSAAGGAGLTGLASRVAPSLAGFNYLNKGVSLLKNIETSSKVMGGVVAYGSSYGDAKIEANRLMPDADESWKTGYATLVGLANAGTEHFFVDKKMFEAFKKEVSPTIAALVQNLNSGNITEAAFKNSFRKVMNDAFTKYLPQSVKENAKEVIEEVSTDFITSGGKLVSVAAGQMDESQFNLADEAEGWVETAQQTAIGTALPGLLAGIGEVRRNRITKKILYDLSQDQNKMDKLSNVIRYQQQIGEMSEKDAIDKLQSISMLKDVGEKIMPPIEQRVKLTDPDKAQLTSLILAQKKLKDQIENPTYAYLKSKNENDLKEVEKQINDIIDGKVIIDDDLNAYTPEEFAKKNKAETQAAEESKAAVAELLNKQQQAREDYIARNGKPKTKEEVEAYDNFSSAISTLDGVNAYFNAPDSYKPKPPKNYKAEAAAQPTQQPIGVVEKQDGTFDVLTPSGATENFATREEADKRALELSQSEVKEGAEAAPATEQKLSPLQQLKQKKDAVQKQEAGQVSVQPTTGVSGEVAQGVPESKPESVTEEGEPAKSEETISSRVGEAVTIQVGGKAITGVVRQDEGGKLTVESGGKVIEVDNETPFADYAHVVRIDDKGKGIIVNDESFADVMFVKDDNGETAWLQRNDGTFKKITTPAIVEELKYQSALKKVDEISDTEAYRINKQYESERKTPQPSKEGTDKGDGGLRGPNQKAEKGQPATPRLTDEERKLKEALDELDLIEKIADEELAQVEGQAKLVEVIPTGSKQSKAYLVKKNKNGEYSATHDGRKVKKSAFLSRLGEAYESANAETIAKAKERLKQQVADLKEEVEAKFYGREPKKKEAPQSTPKSEEQAVTNPALKDVESTAKALEDISNDKFTLYDKEDTPTARDVDYGAVTWQKSGISAFNIASNGKTYITDKDGEIYQILKAKLKQNDSYFIKIKDKNGNEVGGFEFLKNKDGSYSSNESYVTKRRKGLASIAYDYLSEDGIVIKPSKKLKIDGVKFWANSISKAYHSAKKNYSNPEFVKAVEELLAPKEEQVQQAAPAKQSPLQQIKAQKEANRTLIQKIADDDNAVTLSGMTEAERQKAINKRIEKTTLTEAQKLENSLALDVDEFNSMRRNAVLRPPLLQTIRQKANKLGYEVDYTGLGVFVYKKTKQGKRVKINKFGGGDSQIDDGPTFAERSKEFQEMFIKLLELNVPLQPRDFNNSEFTPSKMRATINDIYNGIPSVRASILMDYVQKAIDEKEITYSLSKVGGMEYGYVPLDVAIAEAEALREENMFKNMTDEEIEVMYENEILSQQIQQYETETDNQTDEEGDISETPFGEIDEKSEEKGLKKSGQLSASTKPKNPISRKAFDKLIEKIKKAFPKSNFFSDERTLKEKLAQFGYDMSQFLSVWHGSPYDFDKFSTEKIGTGEGAQAFGWGLYFTDLESIAKNYADKLTEHSVYVNGKEISGLRGTPLYDVSLFIFGQNNISKEQSKENAIANLKQAIRDNRVDYNDAQKAIKYLEGLDSFSVKKDKRNIYKVSIHQGRTPDQYNWLEWDKPITDAQRKLVLSQLEKEGKKDSAEYNEIKSAPKDSFNSYGKDIYRVIENSYSNEYGLGGDKEASLFLLRAGIDGIKYPSESIARGTTSDTARGFNYVVFDENAVTIEEKIQFYRTPKGVIYGAKFPDGSVYINPEYLSAETPIHEAGHLWEAMFPKEWAEGVELFKDTTGFDAALEEIKKNKFYDNLTDAQKASEALNTLIGRKGEGYYKSGVMLSRFKAWVDKFFKTIGDKLFGLTGGKVGRALTADDKLSFFVNEILGDVMGGKEIVHDNKTSQSADTNIKFSKEYELSDAFKKWKGDNELVSKGEVQDVKTGQPVVIRGYHGTTHEFYEFDSSVKGNVEGHLGKVNYFTTDYQDASNNYMSDGADITGRIETQKEFIEQELEDKYDDFFGDKDKIAEEYGYTSNQLTALGSFTALAKDIAEKSLKGGDEQVLDVYIKLNNPIVLGNGATWFETLNVSDEDLEQAAQEIADENDITIEEAKEDYDYDIRDRAIENTGYGNIAIEALQDALSSNGYDSNKASDILGEDVYETEIDLNKLEKKLRSAELYENDNGEMASSQVIADFFKNLGYDGIILTDVADRFKNMGLGGTTSHIHVFNEFSNQIKLADGTNTTFNPDTKDIRFMAGGGSMVTDNNKKVNESIKTLDQLSNQIDEAKDTAAAKAAQAAYEAELKKDPRLNFVISNFGSITGQLEKLNLITKKGDC